MSYEYWFMFPVSIVVASVAMAAENRNFQDNLPHILLERPPSWGR